jgi:protease IV
MQKEIETINLFMTIVLRVKAIDSYMFNKKWFRIAFVIVTVVTVIAFWTFSALVYFEANSEGDASVSTGVNGPVGVVKIHGWIQLVGDSTNYEISSVTIASEINDYANNPDIKVIVLDIHSSGGSTSGADEVIRAIKRVEKPVIAMVREQAVSSAYMIASAADTIYADRYAVVGGMGITGSFVSNAAKNKREGAEFVEISSGPHKDMWNHDRQMTAEERVISQVIVDEHFGVYVQTVAEGRGLPIEDIKQLADGRPYTAEQALKLKLIDKIGGIEDIYAQELEQ